MSGGEYAKFVKAIASRLRLSNGDLLLELAADCGGSLGALQQLYRGRLNTLLAVCRHACPRAREVARAAPASCGRLARTDARVHQLVRFGADRAKVAPWGYVRRDRKFRCLRRCPLAPPALRRVPRDLACFAPGRPAPRRRRGTRSSLHRRLERWHPQRPWREVRKLPPLAAVAPVAFWHACAPIEMEVLISVVEHSELGGTGGHGAPLRTLRCSLCAPRRRTSWR